MKNNPYLTACPKCDTEGLEAHVYDDPPHPRNVCPECEGRGYKPSFDGAQILELINLMGDK